MIIELKPGERAEPLLSQHNKVIFDAYAKWCGPCKMLDEELKKFSEQYPDWTIIKVDVDKNVDQVYQYNIKTVPTMIFAVNGEHVETVIGFRPLEEIKKIVSKY